MAPRSEIEVAIVERFFEYLKVFNIPEIAKLISDDDFVNLTRPSSLGIPDRSKEEYLAFLKWQAEQQGGRPLEITFNGLADAVELAAKVFVHPDIRFETQEGKPFVLESIYIFTFDDNYKFRILAAFEDSCAYPWAK
ncbi:hypothetical protein EDB92DRAFT_2113370 [Lactarius akahatsu]|uniref:SnoaL-like domain-containing protein n=1 Tax=Lactarius akahatsu TaxID=416441 RepID=A0AAD4Q9M0_9AGAM|nr:hypothetical protein EDB92DRAFT_2113370 [Lactarius akahatsu]